MRFLRFCSVLAVLASFYAAPAFAEVRAARIAVVDMTKIMAESDAAKSIQAQLEGARKNFAVEVEGIEKTLRSEETELRQSQATLSSEALNSKSDAFRKKATEAQEKLRGKNAALEAAFNKAIDSLLDQARVVIAEVAEANKADIVLARRQVLLAAKDLELTDQVMVKLNAKVKTIPVDLSGVNAAALKSSR